MEDEAALAKFLKTILPRLQKGKLVIDAEALKCAKKGKGGIFPLPSRLRNRIVITPHAGEMANLLGVTRANVERNARKIALDFAQQNQVITVLKGRETYIASPQGLIFVNRIGNVGLATSGSGDTLSGIIGGLLSRGADPLHASVWGVFLHAAAGDVLAKKIGPLGYLARELLGEIPALMKKLS